MLRSLVMAMSTAGLVSGCNADGLGVPVAPDLSIPFPGDDRDGGGPTDLAFGLSSDLAEPAEPCGDPARDPRIHVATYGPPDAAFPLTGDPMPDPLVQSDGVVRDQSGWLRMNPRPTFNWIWVPNGTDLGGVGTISKLDTTTVREVARYLTTTCYSLKTGGTQQCDGTNGCCSNDDWARYQARKNNQQQPGHQAVQQANNHPSRTAVDYDGSLLVANRGPGGQSSVTRIADDHAECIDRNKNGKIDTSGDTNGNGWIETDCNGDGVPDDIVSVQARPCTNGMKQEFYGNDDECVLWTTNTLAPNSSGTAIALGPGARDANPSDVWTVSQVSGAVLRIDGTTGLAKVDGQLPDACGMGSMGTGPIGMVIDTSAYAWTTGEGMGKLCYFDTKNPAATGVVRDPPWGPNVGWGIALDRDQNIWSGGAVARYTPDRRNGFNSLGNGGWTRIEGVTGYGIAVDSRNQRAYFAWSCTSNNNVLQIPASTIVSKVMDQTVMNANWPVINMPCVAVSVDLSRNVWGVSAQASTRALVDGQGGITQPKVNGMPMGNNKCPAGDSCANVGGDAYSDNIGGRIFTGLIPSPRYSMLIQGCRDGNGNPLPTEWGNLTWESIVPPNTSLEIHARTANSSNPNDPSWRNGRWTVDTSQSPVCLQDSLTPNVTPKGPFDAMDGWLQVEFIFKTLDQTATPVLKSFQVSYVCP